MGVEGTFSGGDRHPAYLISRLANSPLEKSSRPLSDVKRAQLENLRFDPKAAAPFRVLRLWGGGVRLGMLFFHGLPNLHSRYS